MAFRAGSISCVPSSRFASPRVRFFKASVNFDSLMPSLSPTLALQIVMSSPQFFAVYSILAMFDYYVGTGPIAVNLSHGICATLSGLNHRSAPYALPFQLVPCLLAVFVASRVKCSTTTSVPGQRPIRAFETRFPLSWPLPWNQVVQQFKLVLHVCHTPLRIGGLEVCGGSAWAMQTSR